MRSLDEVLPVHRGVVSRFAAELAREDDGDRALPHLDWTVGDVGRHVLSVLRGYVDTLNHDRPIWADARDSETGNRALLDLAAETSPAAIAAAIPDALDGFHRALRETRHDRVHPWGELEMPIEVLPAIHTGDVAVHGHDLSRGTGRPWTITRSEALTTLPAMLQVMPAYVDHAAAAGVQVEYVVHLRGDETYRAAFDDGRLTVSTDGAGRADCRMSVDPVAMVLLSYGRLPLWKAAITGKAIAYGRRPWLGFRFNALLDPP